jgi:23S rRNA (adenine2503-C2)-methyltransferase
LEDARKLAALLQSRKCLVNLIPFNPVKDLPFESPDPARVTEFRKVLEQARLPVTVRRSRGTDINSACGQLRRTQMEEDGLIDPDDCK